MRLVGADRTPAIVVEEREEVDNGVEEDLIELKEDDFFPRRSRSMDPAFGSRLLLFLLFLKWFWQIAGRFSLVSSDSEMRIVEEVLRGFLSCSLSLSLSLSLS